jgi:hypothetical protein
VRVASVVSPAVAGLLAAMLVALASGCSSSTSSALCSTLTRSKVDFSDLDNPAHELAALDKVLERLSPRDRKLVAPVRDYARILYQRSDWSQARKLAFLQHFFKVDAPALDKHLRDDCGVPLDKRIAPFQTALKKAQT